MTHSPAEIDLELIRLTQALEEATDDLRELSVDASKKEVEYKRQYARAILQAIGGTVSDREAKAVLETHEALQDRRIAEALRDSCQERCRTLRANISAVQTMAANLRPQV